MQRSTELAFSSGAGTSAHQSVVVRRVDVEAAPAREVEDAAGGRVPLEHGLGPTVTVKRTQLFEKISREQNWSRDDARIRGGDEVRRTTFPFGDQCAQHAALDERLVTL